MAVSRGNRTEQRIEESEELIKKELKESPSMELRFKDIEERTNLSPRTVSKRLQKMEREGRVARRTRPNEKGVYYKLLDREYLLRDAYMNNIIIDTYSEIDKHRDEYQTFGEAFSDKFASLLLNLFATFEYSEAFKLSLRVLPHFNVFSDEVYDNPKESPKEREQLIKKTERIKELGIDQLEKEVKDSLRKAEEAIASTIIKEVNRMAKTEKITMDEAEQVKKQVEKELKENFNL